MCDLFYEDDLAFHKSWVKAMERSVVLKRMDDVHMLLTLLAEAPGLTQQALTMRHNFAPGLLYRCIQQELITVRVQSIDGHSVFRFYVSATGRARLEQ